jgi:hypothetical protein
MLVSLENDRFVENEYSDEKRRSDIDDIFPTRDSGERRRVKRLLLNTDEIKA